MRIILFPTIVAFGSILNPLQAQEPHIGFALSLAFPTGQFRSCDYTIKEKNGQTYPYNETYDPGWGGQFWLSFRWSAKWPSVQ